MSKTLVTLAALSLTVGSALAAPSAADKTFATEAAQGGAAEVEMGQLAAQKGSHRKSNSSASEW